MPYNSWADVCHLLPERYDTNSKVKLGGFPSQLEVSYVSSHIEQLVYNYVFVFRWVLERTNYC